MTDNDIIKALECCKECPAKENNVECGDVLKNNALKLINRQKAEIEKLQAFKSCFDKLYGKGLEVANWHLNGSTEPFDNFYESALGEMEDG